MKTIKQLLNKMKKQNNPKVGDLIKVIKNSNNHNYKIGETYRVTGISSVDSCTAFSLDGTWVGNWIYYADLEVIGQDKEYFQNKIKELQSQITHTQSILDWMEFTGADQYDADEHKVWTALTTLENDDLSKSEKVKLIASLLK